MAGRLLIASALAAISAAAPAQEPWPPPKASVQDAPPPIIAVTPSPSPPVLVLPPPAIRPAPPPPAARIIRPPQPRRDAQSLILADDYPASALAMRAQGKVRFILDVGPDGRVHGCTITRSSGSAALDSATCMIMRRRSRFTPAIDSTGSPAAGRAAQEVEWALPARP